MVDNLFGMGLTQQDTRCHIYAEANMLRLETPYNRELVDDLKASIPSTERKWDKDHRCWLIAPSHGTTLRKLIRQYFREDIDVPVVKMAAASETRLLEVHYIGATKDRGNGDLSSFAYLANGEWGAIFSETCLRDWFEAPAHSDEPMTLYAILGIKKEDNPDALKSAWRRLVRQWHPDVCKEPDAQEMFIKIQHAFEILSDPGKRAKYNAGLALEASLHAKTTANFAPVGFRPPLRCGWIMAEGIITLDRFVINKILAWEDIHQGDKTLVSSWVMGAKKPTLQWV